jgi:hypothetical protein
LHHREAFSSTVTIVGAEQKQTGKSAEMNTVMTTTLCRPVGPHELELVRRAGFRAFPPRLPEQPIFYPVLSEAYAVKIARDWNVRESGAGYVTRFAVLASFLEAYPIRQAGGSEHLEYWIPAEELATFNESIVGSIEVIAEFQRSAQA